MSETQIARYYVAENNPDIGELPGVPLRDLTQAEFDSFPQWLQYSIDGHPMYRRTAPKTAPAPAPKE